MYLPSTARAGHVISDLGLGTTEKEKNQDDLAQWHVNYAEVTVKRIHVATS